MFCLNLCLCDMCMPGVSGDHKDRLKLQIVVSLRVSAGGSNLSLLDEQSMLTTAEPSLSPSEEEIFE